MSHKIIKILALSLIIASSFTFLFEKFKSEKILKRDLYYDVYNYNTDPFTNVIDSQFPIQSFKDTFKIFGDILNNQILDLKNPCGKLKNKNDRLAIIIVQHPYNDFRVSMYSSDVDLMDKCKVYIDELVDTQNVKIKKLYQTLYMIIMDTPRPGMKNRFRYLDPSSIDDFFMLRFRSEQLSTVKSLTVMEIFASALFFTFIAIFMFFFLFSKNMRSKFRKAITDLDELIS